MLSGYVGSISHGTAGDVIDDIDVCGIFISPKSHYLGLTRTDHIMRNQIINKYDFALFEIQKYFRLLLANNPNVMSLLWLPENMYIDRNEWGKLLLANRINVYRHDNKMLKEIKYGKWTLEQVEKESERLQHFLDEAFVHCTLPNFPDFRKAEDLLMEILSDSFKSL
jgi:predicted nucleotidyltransferase